MLRPEYTCGACLGRGYQPRKDACGAIDWPVACPNCKGRGGFSARGVCKRLSIDRRTLRAIEGYSARIPQSATCLRVLEAIGRSGLYEAST